MDNLFTFFQKKMKKGIAWWMHNAQGVDTGFCLKSGSEMFSRCFQTF